MGVKTTPNEWHLPARSVVLQSRGRPPQSSLPGGHSGGRPSRAALRHRLRARGQGQRVPRPLVQEGLRHSYIQVGLKLFTVLQGWSEWPQQKVKWYQALSKCDEDWVFHLTEKPSLIGSPDMLQTSIIKHWYFGSIVNSKSNTVCSTSIYFSYDSRTGDPGNKGLWSEPAAFGERAHFRVGQSPAVLSIRNLTKEDGGVYTCRSDGLQPRQPGYV